MVKESSRPGNDGTSGLTMMAWAGGGGGLTIGGGRGLVTGEKIRGGGEWLLTMEYLILKNYDKYDDVGDE